VGDELSSTPGAVTLLSRRSNHFRPEAGAAAREHPPLLAREDALTRRVTRVLLRGAQGRLRHEAALRRTGEPSQRVSSRHRASAGFHAPPPPPGRSRSRARDLSARSHRRSREPTHKYEAGDASTQASPALVAHPAPDMDMMDEVRSAVA
jgi:hypothetical protein